tara:strand:- start:1195 stop:1407 length:213 start_codon:yes stop_codon:yes gene_type:complete
VTSVVKIKTKPIFAARRVKKCDCEERLHAHAVKRIYNRQTGEHVGWLYEWNNGDLVPRWSAAPHSDVFYR